MSTDCGVRKVWAWVEQPTENPSRMVTISTIEVRAVWAKRSVTPLSLSRLPKNSMPSKPIAPGARSAQMRKATIGKMIFSRCETSRGGFMRISRSLRVVKSFITGG